MLEHLNKLFTETVKLSQDVWLIILLSVVGLAFLIALIAGLAGGEFNKIKSLMKRTTADPSKAVVFMKQMPPVIKKEYKRARMANVEPSAFVTEADCVDRPYARSLVSKIWLVTLIATVVCAMIGFFIAPLAAQSAIAAEAEKIAASVEAGAEDIVPELDERLLANAVYIIPLIVFAVGGLLTLIGGAVGLGAHGGAHGIYSKFAVAIDGGVQGGQFAEQQQPAQEQAQTQDGIAFDRQDDGAQVYAEQPVYAAEQQPMYAEPQQEYVDQQPMYAEPQQEQVFATPVQDMRQQSEEDMRRAREEAIARARAEQEAQIAAQQTAARQAAAQAAAQQQFAAQQAARRQQPQPQPQPQPVVQSAGPSSADEVIARIEQIDRDGAPRETMREVASLLQKERQKPENKTPEQQKKLNEALSKLLKAMSAASRK